MSQTLAVGLVIGASLASSVGSSIGFVGDKLSQLQKKSDSLKVGAALGKSFQDLKAETLRVRQEYEKTGFKSAELGGKLLQLQRATREAGREAQKYGIELGKAAKQTKYLETASAQAEARIGRIQARQARAEERSVLKGQLLGATAAVASIGIALKPSIDFEDAFAGVRKVVDMTDAEAADLKRGILDLTSQIPMTATELTSIVESAGQMGVKGKGPLLEFTTAAAKMGIAFDISAAEAGRAMAEIRNSSNLTQAQVVSLGDAINHLSDNTAGKAPQIIEFMRRAGGVGRLAGLAPEKMAALGTAFDAAGVAPERSARAVNDLVMRLSRVNEASDSVKAAFEEMGYDTAKLQQQMLIDPQGTILQFLERAGKQKNVLAALSGTIGAGFADEMALLVANVDKYKEALSLVGQKSNYDGSMDREFQRRSETTANSLIILRNQMNRIAISVGSVFLPHIAKGAQAVGDIAAKFAQWAEANPKTVKMIGGIVAGFVGMKVAGLGSRIVFSHALDVFSNANGILQKLRPSSIQAAIGLMRMKGAGGVFARALAPLRSFKGGFVKDAQAVGNALSWMKKGFVSGAGHIGKFGKGAVGVFKTCGTAILGFGKTLLLGIKGVGMALMANPIVLVIGAIVAVVAFAAYKIWKNWDTVKVWLSNFWEGIKTRWNSAVEWVGSAVSGLGEDIKAPFVTAFAWIGDKIDWISKKWSDFKSAFSLSSGPTPTFRGGRDGNGYVGSVINEGHATGGVFNKPHIAAFAEGGKAEAAIPLEGHRDRARSIWAYSGQKLGMFGKGGGEKRTPPGHSGPPVIINVYPSQGMDENALAQKVFRLFKREQARHEGRTFSDAALAG